MSTSRKRTGPSKKAYIISVIIFLIVWLIFNYPTIKEYWEELRTGVSQGSETSQDSGTGGSGDIHQDIEDASEIEGAAYKVVNGNQPYFTDDEKKSLEPFEIYSPLDGLGRCGVAYANICKELMPTEERGDIGHVKPSGWQSVKYDHVDGKYLYNRSHLIGFQLAGENDNKLNLITGTRYFNVTGMLPFENLIDDYVDETENHVIYRVTPIYEDDNLVANGVLMEAWSVEDDGEGVCFCVFVPNVQPGVIIDYETGESRAE
jgi:DNA-entry nuclease